MEYVTDVSSWSNLLREHGYDLLGQLDSGSFSEVFAVKCLASHRPLAVKRMVARREITTDPRILKEIACLKQLNNLRGSCVIQLEGTFWKSDRLACLVLELAPMGDLERHAAERWPLSSRLVSGTVRQVLSALTHCHRLNIAHRDINPANVLLMSEHSVRLADFGLAFHCRDSSGRWRLCEDYLGRESYLAPEVLLCTPYDALLADMWSVSSLCMFLLTGKHPLPRKGYAFSERPREEKLTIKQDLNGKSSSSSTVLKPHGHRFKAPPSAARRRTHGQRCSSYDSESSCRSESDVDDSVAPLTSTSSVDNKPDLSLSSQSSDSDDCNCPWEGHQTAGIVEEEVFKPVDVLKELTAAECAALHLASRLREQNPLGRLAAEDALALWKSISRTWASNSDGLSA